MPRTRLARRRARRHAGQSHTAYQRRMDCALAQRLERGNVADTKKRLNVELLTRQPGEILQALLSNFD